MRLVAAIEGRLSEVMEAERVAGATAATAATRQATEQLKQRLRAMTVAAFGSQRLANSWRASAFPKGATVSLGAAGNVWSKAPHIMQAFDATTTIRGRNGFWLAIPSPEAMKMRTANRRPTPDDVERRLGIRLRYVFRAQGASLLVADKVRRHTGKRKGFAKASKKALRDGNTESVVMFFLVEQVTLRKRFDLDAEFDGALDNMVNLIVAAWDSR
jgi:hypothetical protein